MVQVAYSLVDVFTSQPFGGNPLAVFADARDVPPEFMQPIARELNLSETTFVLPPEDPANDYRVRIFTPAGEIPFAGHPTIGTAYVLASPMTKPDGATELALRFEEGVGVIPVTVGLVDTGPDLIWMHQPLPTFGPRFDDVDIFAELLSLPRDAVRDTGLPVEVGTAGLPFLYIPVRSRADLGRVRVRLDVADRLPPDANLGAVFVFTLDVGDADATARSRMLAPAFGIAEDPATGSASGPLGAYLVRHGIVTEGPTAHIISEQGIEMGRPSRIEIEVDHADGAITAVRVGGRCVAMGGGALSLP